VFLAGFANTEQTRNYQSTPEGTVNKMFELLKSQGNGLSTVDFLADKNLTPEEQQFAELFWDAQRCGILYSALYDREPELQALIGQGVTTDSATINAQVKALASADDLEKSDRVYIFVLKRRSENWHIYELKSENVPNGVFRKFEELKSGAP
jgi:hypothetical protein